ncbi:MAG: hypothetical protein H8E32_02490 [Nitrospinae bacterium]|nr:hypothetical protein [Nitrospinota bacterium]
MDIPTIPLEKLVNKVMKILSGENSSLIPLGLKTQLQPGKILQGEILKILPKGKATVSIAGQKVVAELPDVRTKPQDNSSTTKPEYSFRPGQKIYAQVEKVNPSPVLKLIPPPEQKIQEEGYTTNLSRKIKPEILKYENFKELKLPPDNIVPVKINRINNANTLSVQFEDQEFLVKTENANLYRPGATVRIQFQKVENGFKSVLLDSPTKSGNIDIELIKPYLPSRTPLGKLVGELTRDILGSPVLKELAVKPELVGRLRETLQALTPRPDTLPDKAEIKGQVEKSGVRYEAKVRQLLSQPDNSKIRIELAKDLKGQLLELNQITEKAIKNLSEQNTNRQISEFQQRVKVSVDSVELNQLSSRVSNQENQPLVLQIPNPLSPDDQTINLFIRKDSEGEGDGRKGDSEFYNLAFFLDLSALGNIKINAKVGAESLAVRMDVEHESIAEFIRNNSTEFEQQMEKEDMKTTVECCYEEKVHPIKDNLIELLVSQNTSLLNVKT